MVGNKSTTSDGILKVRKSSWHYRLYRYWQEKGGENSWGYRENLCHYCRVVAFWAPKRWFLYAQLWGVLRPWMIMAAAVLIAAIVTSAYLWPIRLVTVLAIIASYAVIIVTTRVGGKALIRKLRSIQWWNQHEETVAMAIAGVLFAAIGLALLVILGFIAYKYPVPFFVGLAGAIGFAGVVLSGIYGIRRWRERDASAPTGFLGPASRALRKVGDDAKLVVHYAVAKKRRICPFIGFVDR